MYDTQPFGWHFAFVAVGTGLVYALPLLIAAYMTSDFHRRGVARLRRSQKVK